MHKLKYLPLFLIFLLLALTACRDESAPKPAPKDVATAPAEGP